MSDVFISYKRENLKELQPLVKALRARGLAVWWDQDIPPDAPWEQTITREHGLAKAVVVAWSPAAAASENVKAEARQARNEGKLLQVFVEACEPPMFFGERQGVDLVGWSGRADDHRFLALAAALDALIAGMPPPEGVGFAPKRTRPRTWEALGATAAATAAMISVVANLGGARDTLCGIGSLRSACQASGLTAPSPSDPTLVAAAARLNLVRSVNGIWGRQNDSCAHSIAITTDAIGSQINVRGANGYASSGDVVTVDTDKRVIFTRNTAGTAVDPHAQWEYHPSGDQLTVIDKDGTPTTFVHCNARPA